MSTVNSASSSSYATSTYITSFTDLDTSSLVEAAYEADTAAADTIELEVEENDLKIAAYEDAISNLTDLQEALSQLTIDPGLDTLRDDVWDDLTSYLSSSSSSVTASDVLGATVSSDAEAGSYTIEVSQIATIQKVASDSQTSQTEALGLTGTFELAATDGTSTSIDVSEDMSLQDLEEAIDAVSEETGVSASILQVSDDEFILVLTTENTGQTITTSSTSGTDILQSLGMTDGDGGFDNELQAGQNAILYVDGVEITRSDNTIDDLIEGVTISLYDAEPGTELTLKIEQNLSDAYSQIEAFVEAYNTYRAFALEQQAYGDEGADDEAYLFGDNSLASANDAIYDALTSSFSSDFDVLASIGISFDDDNYLVIDETELENALVTDPAAVQSLFALETTSSTDDALILEVGDSLPDSFTIDLTVDEDGTLTGASINGDSSLLTVENGYIKGVDGTEYEGLSIYFAGDTSQSIDFTVSYGLAEVLVNSLESSIDTIEEAKSALSETNEELEEEVEDIKEAATERAQGLIKKYAAIEAKLYQLELLREQLSALWGTDD